MVDLQQLLYVRKHSVQPVQQQTIDKTNFRFQFFQSHRACFTTSLKWIQFVLVKSTGSEHLQNVFTTNELHVSMFEWLIHQC